MRSLTGSAANPSAYNCTKAASSTRSTRYFRPDASGPNAPSDGLAGGCSVSGAGAGPEHAIDMAATVMANNPLRINLFSLTPLARGGPGCALSNAGATQLSISAH